MMPAADRFRPVVAIDIDGVLRLAARPDRPKPDGAYPVELTMRADAYPSFFHRPPDWGEDGTQTKTHWLSGIGAEWIRSLLKRGVEVVWATTWQEYANVYFAEPLGIPALPLGVSGGGDEYEYPDSPEWKCMALAQRFPGRPLVWVDDNPVVVADRELSAIRSPRDRALTRSYWVTHPERGLTREDVTRLDGWLTLASTPEGHEALRRRRRNRLRRTQRFVARLDHGTLARAARWDRVYKMLLTRLDERDSYVASELANSVRDNTFDRDRFRDLFAQREWFAPKGGVEKLLDAVEDHVRREEQRQRKGRR